METFSISNNPVVKRLPINTGNIGRKIGNGSQFEVYEYGRTEVIKFVKARLRPSIVSGVSQCIGGQSKHSVTEDNELIREYFNHYHTHTEVIEGEDDEFACIQRRIRHSRVTAEMLKTQKEVYNQMKDIMRRNRKLIKERARMLDCMGFDHGRFFSFLSPEGTPYLDNIVWEESSQKLRIVDGTYSVRNIILFLIQHENARRLGYEFGEPTIRQLLGR